MDNSIKSEFLNYLTSFGVELNIYDSTMVSYSDFEKELIDIVINIVDDLFLVMSNARNICPAIHSFCHLDNKVDAFCCKNTNKYYIAVSSGTYVELFRRSQKLVEYIIQNSMLDYKKENLLDLQIKMWSYAVKMVLKHEYMHVILGHCDLYHSSEFFIWEMSNDKYYEEKEETDNIGRHALEMFADMFACKDSVEQMYATTKNDLQAFKNELSTFYLSLLLVFSIFEDNSGKMRRHPHLNVRMYYIASTIDDTITKIFNSLGKSKTEINKLLYEINSIVDNCIKLAFKNSELFNSELISTWPQSNVDKELIELYNTAAKIVKQTNKHAFFSIDEFDKVNFGEVAELFTNEKEYLFKASKMGMTFAEVNEILNNANQNI